MGLIVPYISVDQQMPPGTPDLELTNAYLAIADYDVTFRNYNYTTSNQPMVTDSNTGSNFPAYPVSSFGMNMSVNYGIWDSKDSRDSNIFPYTVRTVQAPYDQASGSSSNVFTYAYDILKMTYSNATDA